jgi:hypothetical protein
MPSPDERIARLDALLERANRLPSWPTMAARLARLTQDIEILKTRVAELEQECEALRQRELAQLWDREA